MINNSTSTFNQSNVSSNSQSGQLIASSKHVSNPYLYNQPAKSSNQNDVKIRRAVSDNRLVYNIPKPKKEEKGFFSGLFDALNPWKIEEEEYIDAHGFKCKRPKEKIPLRKKGDKDKNEIQRTGTESISYATQHSAFGGVFM